MTSLPNSMWQNRKERPNQSTNNGYMVEKIGEKDWNNNTSAMAYHNKNVIYIHSKHNFYQQRSLSVVMMKMSVNYFLIDCVLLHKKG